MRIGIYAETATDPKPTGIGLHVRELLKSLAEIDDENEYYLYFPNSSHRGAKALTQLNLGEHFYERPVWCPFEWNTRRPRLWWQWYLPWMIRRDRLDLFHGPNHFVPLPRRAKTVVTLHDLAYFRMNVHGTTMDQSMRIWTERALEWSDRIIALSENTRLDVEKLGVSPDRVRVIYGGGHVVPDAEIQFNRIHELRKQFRLPDRFILFVGTIQPRKNVPFLVRAYAKAKASGQITQKLVLAGHRDSAAEEVESLARSLGIANDVIITGYVENWQLPLLYKLADLFVLPTLYEGFTLVTLEAMAYGTPVIATDTSSIREGVGDAAILVPVNDDNALANAIQTVLTDTELRDRLINRGEARSKMFTWRQCAEKTLDLYRELAQPSSSPDRRQFAMAN